MNNESPNIFPLVAFDLKLVVYGQSLQRTYDNTIGKNCETRARKWRFLAVGEILWLFSPIVGEKIVILTDNWWELCCIQFLTSKIEILTSYGENFNSHHICGEKYQSHHRYGEN